MVFIIGHLESTKYICLVCKKNSVHAISKYPYGKLSLFFVWFVKIVITIWLAKIQFIFWTRLNSDSRSKNAAFFIDQKVNTVTIHSLLNNIRRSLLWANTTACINFFSNCYGWWANMAYIVCTTIIYYCYNL